MGDGQASGHREGRHMDYFDIVFSEVPDTPNLTFMEVEDPEGRSFSVGEWVTDEKGYHRLRVRKMPHLRGQGRCDQEDHAWTPWFQLPNTSFVTICGREGCPAERQYDL